MTVSILIWERRSKGGTQEELTGGERAIGRGKRDDEIENWDGEIVWDEVWDVPIEYLPVVIDDGDPIILSIERKETKDRVLHEDVTSLRLIDCPLFYPLSPDHTVLIFH